MKRQLCPILIVKRNQFDKKHKQKAHHPISPHKLNAIPVEFIPTKQHYSSHSHSCQKPTYTKSPLRVKWNFAKISSKIVSQLTSEPRRENTVVRLPQSLCASHAHSHNTQRVLIYIHTHIILYVCVCASTVSIKHLKNSNQVWNTPKKNG